MKLCLRGHARSSCLVALLQTFIIQSPEQQESGSLVHLTEDFFLPNPCQESVW